jgi:hypothetical protein
MKNGSCWAARDGRAEGKRVLTTKVTKIFTKDAKEVRVVVLDGAISKLPN